jgi:HlyD family secretion protein
LRQIKILGPQQARAVRHGLLILIRIKGRATRTGYQKQLGKRLSIIKMNLRVDIAPSPGGSAPPLPEIARLPIVSGGRRRRGWLFSAVATVAALLVAIVTGWWLLQSGPIVQYVTVPVTTGPVTRTVTATGTVNPELTIIVGTYVSGVIQEITCDYNTRVRRGQTCAKIDPRPYQTQVDQARAGLAVAKAQLERDRASLAYAKLAYERAAALIKTNAVSKDAFDNAKSVYEQALAQITYDEATIQQRQSALDAAQVNLDYTNIVSPIDGTVVSRNVTIGQTVAASFQTPTLFLIASDLTRMQVDTNVSESDIGGISVGDAVTFAVDAFPKRTFKGTVVQVRQSPQTVQNVVTYDVVVSVANSDLALKPGLTAATRIIVDQRDNAVRVPNQALRYTPTTSSPGRSELTRVWLLRDGRPVLVQVTTGLDDERHTEIVRGDLTAGDQVIVGEQRSGAPTRSIVPRPRL